MPVIDTYSIFYWVLTVIYYILFAVAGWTIFKKAGEKGWKAIIPIYNAYVLVKLIWKARYFFIILILAIITSLCFSFINGPFLIPSLICGVAFAIATMIFYIMALYRFSKSFGHGVGFTVGLYFFNIIFILIIAFGKSEYRKID